MKHILVVGASGRTGRLVVDQAIRRGDAVTAFVRSRAKANSFPAEVRTAFGDGLDARAVANAVAGQDAVIVAVGDRTTLVSAAVVANVIQGMKAAGVRRVVLLSAYGIGDSGHGLQGFVFRTALRKLNADKMEAERLLFESGLDWTAIRAPALTTKPAKGNVRAAVDVTINGFRGLPREDLAAFMLDEVERNRFVRQKPILTPA